MLISGLISQTYLLISSFRECLHFPSLRHEDRRPRLPQGEYCEPISGVFGCLTSLGRTVGSFRGDLEHERAFSRIDRRQPHKSGNQLMWATAEKLPPVLDWDQQSRAGVTSAEVR